MRVSRKDEEKRSVLGLNANISLLLSQFGSLLALLGLLLQLRRDAALVGDAATAARAERALQRVAVRRLRAPLRRRLHRLTTHAHPTR